MVVGPERSIGGIAFIFLALPVLGVAAYGIIDAWLTGEVRGLVEKLIVVAWLTGWGALFALFLLKALSNLWAYWRLTITGATLTVAASLLSYRRIRSYPLAMISNLRIEERHRRRGLILRRIAFECQGRTAYATPDLSLKEARALLDGPLRDLPRNRR